MAMNYANERGLESETIYAKWSELGSKAGPMRNREMARQAHATIAFWDGESKGTASMIKEAERAKHEAVITINI